MLRVLFGAAWLLLLAPTFAWGEILLSNENFTYTQDFNTLARSGTNNTALPTGWYFQEFGTGADSTYAAWLPVQNPLRGNTYSFGSGTAADRSLGMYRTASFNSIIGAQFTNTGTTAIESLLISYWGEQWWLGASGRTDRLDFQYSLNATSLTTGDWIDVNALDFHSLITNGNGSLAGNTQHAFLSSQINGLNIAPGETFWIRWTDFDVAGADDGLAIDDFSLVARFGEPASVPEPTTTAALAFFSAGGWVARRLFQRRNRDKKAA